MDNCDELNLLNTKLEMEELIIKPECDNDANQHSSSVTSKSDQVSYAVVYFRVENTYATVPAKWLVDAGTKKVCWWPPKLAHSAIKQSAEPGDNWALYPIELIEKCDTYKEALIKERMVHSADSNSFMVSACGRCMHRIKEDKITQVADNHKDDDSDSTTDDEPDTEINLPPATGEEVNCLINPNQTDIVKREFDCISENSSDSNAPPQEMNEVANITCLSILPEKSKNRYEKTYKSFKTWCSVKEVFATSEKIMLDYIMERAHILQPNSLWCEYSMLKSTIHLNENIDISSYQKLRAFLKKKNIGHRPKKSSVFSGEQIHKFLVEAPDDIYLMKKVTTIFGVLGALRINELCRIKINDIEDKGLFILVNVFDSKIRAQKSFTVMDNEKENFHVVHLIRKYSSLRPKFIDNDRYFLKYQNGRCFKQVVGKNTFAKIPSEVARFLNLENPGKYTGHAFKKTSARQFKCNKE